MPALYSKKCYMTRESVINRHFYHLNVLKENDRKRNWDAKAYDLYENSKYWAPRYKEFADLWYHAEQMTNKKDREYIIKCFMGTFEFSQEPQERTTYDGQTVVRYYGVTKSGAPRWYDRTVNDDNEVIIERVSEWDEALTYYRHQLAFEKEQRAKYPNAIRYS